MSWLGGVRSSNFYVVYHGRDFRAGTLNLGHDVALFWAEGEGPRPEFFDPVRQRTGGTSNSIPASEIDRAYLLTVTCSYRGGGPFEVMAYPKDPALFWLVYRGDDPQWALGQPGMEADFSEMWGYRRPEVVGLIGVGEISDVREQEQTVRLPRRRRTSKPSASSKPSAKRAGRAGSS